MSLDHLPFSMWAVYLDSGRLSPSSQGANTLPTGEGPDSRGDQSQPLRALNAFVSLGPAQAPTTACAHLGAGPTSVCSIHGAKLTLLRPGLPPGWIYLNDEYTPTHTPCPDPYYV